jgi:hypothetical protein
MKTKIRCAGEDVLVPIVEAAGLQEMRITRIDASIYVLSITLRTKRDRIYLATRRNPEQPRQFKGIEAAAAVGRKLFHAKQATLMLV